MNGVFVGSFNPFHIGHRQVVDTALKFCHHLFICVALNREKTLPPDFRTREEWIRRSLSDQDLPDRITICSTDGLITDFCLENNIGLIVKGCRNTLDFENERSMGNTNKKLNPLVDTILVPSPPELVDISSSLVRTLVQFGHPITGLVSKDIEDEVVDYFGKPNS